MRSVQGPSDQNCRKLHEPLYQKCATILEFTESSESLLKLSREACSETAVRRCSSKIGVLKNFAILTGKHRC